MSKFDYWITTDKIIPPLNGIGNFSAKAVVYEISDGTSKQIDTGLCETWGLTENEAHNKMKERLDDWLEKNK